jgi:hypothetical protein
MKKQIPGRITKLSNIKLFQVIPNRILSLRNFKEFFLDLMLFDVTGEICYETLPRDKKE